MPHRRSIADRIRRRGLRAAGAGMVLPTGEPDGVEGERMSQYTVCRACGADLQPNGVAFGANECCCNNGYCIACCLEGADDE